MRTRFSTKRTGRRVDGCQVGRELTGSFHSCLVQNFVNDIPIVGQVIFFSQNLGGNLNQVRFQLGLVPFDKDLGHFFIVDSNNLFENLVHFSNELHVAIFDAVMDPVG